MIQIPDISKGQKAMIFLKESWWAVYYEDGKQRRRNLGVREESLALVQRDKLFRQFKREGAVRYGKRTPQQKVLNKPGLYCYSRPPYQFKVKGVVLFESWAEAEVYAARDAYLETYKNETP